MVNAAVVSAVTPLPLPRPLNGSAPCSSDAFHRVPTWIDQTSPSPSGPPRQASPSGQLALVHGRRGYGRREPAWLPDRGTQKSIVPSVEHGCLPAFLQEHKNQAMWTLIGFLTLLVVIVGAKYYSIQSQKKAAILLSEIMERYDEAARTKEPGRPWPRCKAISRVAWTPMAEKRPGRSVGSCSRTFLQGNQVRRGHRAVPARPAQLRGHPTGHRR